MSRANRHSPTAEDIVTALSRLRFANVFNPYSDRCETHDLPDGPEIRSTNLLATLGAAQSGVDALWIALEPGHIGARRTGLAMTDERNLEAHSIRWGLAEIQRATKSGPDSEQTARIVWEALARDPRRIFLWNVFPLHSHVPRKPLTNRRHTRAEREACLEITNAVISFVKPQQIVAIGNDSYAAMVETCRPCIKVRHPARGGKAAFLAGTAIPMAELGSSLTT